MKVTIITCCFNRAGTIEHSINSVISQSYKDIEYIVVDGGSTDGSREIINKYADNIAVKIFEPDRGMYEAINKGVRASTGDVIAFCHSDDRLNGPDTVESIVHEFEKTGADMVYADGIFLRRRSSSHEEPARIWEGGICKPWKLKCAWLPLHTTCFIKKSVYDKCGLYDESYKISADSKFLLDILNNHKIKVAYLPKVVVKMRMGGTSTSSTHFQEMWQEDLRAFKETGFKFPTVRKVMKMMWKVPQLIKAKFNNRKA